MRPSTAFMPDAVEASDWGPSSRRPAWPSTLQLAARVQAAVAARPAERRFLSLDERPEGALQSHGRLLDSSRWALAGCGPSWYAGDTRQGHRAYPREKDAGTRCAGGRQAAARSCRLGTTRGRSLAGSTQGGGPLVRVGAVGARADAHRPRLKGDGLLPTLPPLRSWGGFFGSPGCHGGHPVPPLRRHRAQSAAAAPPGEQR